MRIPLALAAALLPLFGTRAGASSPALTLFATNATSARTAAHAVDEPGRGRALRLEKRAPTAEEGAAGARVAGVDGLVLTELGFDVLRAGHCGLASPRLHVTTRDGASYVFACGHGEHRLVAGAPGWSRVRFCDADAHAPEGAPPWPGFGVAVAARVDLVFDQGVDVGPGYAVVDDVDVNGTLLSP
jgi:hypothetical protein